MENNKRLFMKPGETNEEDRRNFIKFWVRYMKSTSDKEWSKQQNIIINSQVQIAKSEPFLRKSALSNLRGHF